MSEFLDNLFIEAMPDDADHKNDNIPLLSEQEITSFYQNRHLVSLYAPLNTKTPEASQKPHTTHPETSEASFDKEVQARLITKLEKATKASIARAREVNYE